MSANATAADIQGIGTSPGVTWEGSPISAQLTPGMLDLNSERARILIVSVEEKANLAARQVWEKFSNTESTAPVRQRLEVGLVTAPAGDADWTAGFPPSGNAYNQERNAEHHYLWRWIGMLAPDIVIAVRNGERDELRIPAKLTDSRVANSAQFNPAILSQHDSLAWALSSGKPCDVASIPAVEVVAANDGSSLSDLLPTISNTRSPAREELLRRQARSPIQVAEELAKTYGHNLRSVVYIPALALIGRLRISELTGDMSHQEDVMKIVEPYRSGKTPPLGKRVSGSSLSGHLVFGELARKTRDERFIELARAAADFGFDDQGQPREVMPFHNEMSDAVFMGTPILVQAGRLTGETRFYDMAMRHLQFMLKLNVREDGLHQHSPLDPEHSAWGRGNGFPALGLALSLSDLPEDSPHRAEMLAAYRAHLTAMLNYQDEMGMWHQVVDRPESYREFTSTCMTTFAMTRGIRRGWLDRERFEPAVRKAWESIKCRIGPEGQLVDVCTGTGKQKSLRNYFHRTAILGRDDRGGAMALLAATELAFLGRDTASSNP